MFSISIDGKVLTQMGGYLRTWTRWAGSASAARRRLDKLIVGLGLLGLTVCWGMALAIRASTRALAPAIIRPMCVGVEIAVLMIACLGVYLLAERVVIVAAPFTRWVIEQSNSSTLPRRASSS